jgi:hypothetical protein
MYKTPDEFYMRLHHVRPRFKNDVENVLIFMATEISKIPPLKKEKFKKKVNAAVKNYPGNSEKDDKTINNWRTEISALFGFIAHDGDMDCCGLRATELSDSGDLIEFFKTFLYTFQYPGAHIKSHEISHQIKSGVSFKPAKTIMQILRSGETKTNKRAWITKSEACHMIFSDLRVVRDNESSEITWDRISKNREDEVVYDSKSDTVRYAGDIIDYMVAANLLVTYDNKRYYINTLETEAIEKFVNSTEWFSGYDSLIKACLADSYYEPKLSDIKEQYDNWYAYVNRKLEDTDFSTDIFTFFSETDEKEAPVSDTQKYFKQLLESGADISTKEIGDFGESLVFAHECARLRAEEAEDVIHLIKRIPTALALGYDINSREVDERHRYIEVKTTISSKPIQLYKFHLTRNEWNAAETNRGQYFIYRLMVSKEQIKLFIISDPVGLYKKDVISMSPTDGADVSFKPETAGSYEELLS